MQTQAKSISIIGSTGSIGTQALDIIASRPEDFEVIALSAGSNLHELVEQIKEFKPKYVSIVKDKDKREIQELFPDIVVLKNNNEIAELNGVDIFLSAIVGIAGLEPNLIALKHAKKVAVANKETLVAAGHLVQEYCEKYNSELIPVDSEHVAIHQCLRGLNGDHEHSHKVKEILLTSSGGPFRTLAHSEFPNITLNDALKHPTWSMGAKITIDSSTLMNKALEVIEVNSLFGIDYEKIKVIIHPQSIIHSAVTFIDGNTIAQLGNPDMRIPIQYAIDYPDRKQVHFDDGFNLCDMRKLEFHEPDHDKFPTLKLAYQAGKLGHSFPTVLNSANEAAVELFQHEKIHYLDIVKIIEEELSNHEIVKNPQIEDILHHDREIKERRVHSKLA